MWLLRSLCRNKKVSMVLRSGDTALEQHKIHENGQYSRSKMTVGICSMILSLDKNLLAADKIVFLGRHRITNGKNLCLKCV